MPRAVAVIALLAANLCPDTYPPGYIGQGQRPKTRLTFDCGVKGVADAARWLVPGLPRLGESAWPGDDVVVDTITR
jgi:hypothetical protein